jgi:hypothetical protein|tara:strand:+ start:426 stop:914 length:489 start_codon:yes stop_codon:yes gene_type:complete
MDEFGEGIGNPFDTPIPGQSLTDEPGNYPWEHPPQFVETDEAADYLWDKMSEPEIAEQVIALLDAGVPVEAIGRAALFGGFLNGKFTPDVAFIIAEPVMKMILTIGVMAGIKDIKVSMDDITNKNEIRSAVRLKQEAKRIGQEVQEEIKQKGIMSKPETEEI